MRFLDTVYELNEEGIERVNVEHEPRWIRNVWRKNVLGSSGSWAADMERGGVADNLDGAEAPRDPGALTTHPSYTDKDFEGHRAHTVYVGLHVPGYRRRASASGPSGHHRRHRHHGKKGSPGGQTGTGPQPEDKVQAPAERIHFLLGEEDEGHEVHPLFSEMEVLTQSMDSGDYEWREAARWIKYEEDVEEGGDRWSKPHVSTISLHSLMDLRSFLLNGTVLLDMEATSLENIAELILENMVNSKQLPMSALDCRDRIKEILLKRHRHQHEKRQTDAKRLPLIRSLADIGRNSSKSMFGSTNNSDIEAGATPAPAVQTHAGPLLSVPGASVPACADQLQLHGSPSSNSLHAGPPAGNNENSSPDLHHRLNQAFMRKVPPGSQAVNILVGEVDFLERPIMAFVRLNQAMSLGDLTEVPVPTRFFFLLLGPTGNMVRYHEVGRAIGILMTDEVFHDVAFKAKNRDHLLAGVDEFLDAATVLPPGAWDPATRIEPPQHAPSQEARKKQESELTPKLDPEEEEEREREESGLKRTGVLWGGLKNDIMRKMPWYISDFKDACSLQSVASIFFLYFACLTPIITFGGLLGSATENRIAAMESLMSGAVCGVLYGLFSGQPLTILGSTGPVLVFETIMYDFCKEHGLDYLSLRFWVGLWTMVILIYLVALDASALVCYITRFTEENFATLISLIFIIEAFKNVGKIGHKMPLNTDLKLRIDCECLPPANSSNREAFQNLSRYGCYAAGGEWEGTGCQYVPDVFLLSVVLFAATFILATSLKSFKFTSYFPTWVRAIVSDFAVVIAISAVSLADLAIGLETPKLNVPEKFEPTWSGRGWLIPPFNHNPWWTVLLAIPPAMLATILIFMDQQITAVIINRKENKLKKGCGYHLDLLVLAVLIGICSVFGLPWFVAATVLAMTHVNSLKMESETSAPGEKPQFLGVREQRITQVAIFALVGMSVFFTAVLKHIPMPVLYGVFLYMGVSSLQGSQLFARILIIFMPQKYQPDYMFLRSVPTLRVHLFTFIQVLCLASLWLIKSYKQTSISFPLMLVVMIGVRKCLDFIFTRKELKVLDDIMPEHKRQEEAEKNRDSDSGNVGSSGGDNCALEMKTTGGELGGVSIQLVNGDIMECKEPVPGINISEQLQKTTLWKAIDQQNVPEKEKPPVPTIVTESTGGNRRKKKRGSKKDAVSEEERRRLSTMTEENNDEDDDCGITIKIQSATPVPQSSPQEAKKSFLGQQQDPVQQPGKGSETTV
ncbi:electroneutral sodium bicarbonate exchanger 1-like isoform X1 [Varroa jacobsoni]|uniref:electroneutral sodium bicarbonate exchanger 1-like isoform X1 n=2 Tax=Varroa jacobsoni TaxID=62625 RepID=UPI000BF31E1B|nr:electroneutral sodium bicarbonate exchanger 1-like isoform X1 [Varroa jacobsoni]